MKIVSIVSLKRADKCQIQFDNGDFFLCSLDLVLKYKLSKELEIDEQLLYLLQKEQRIIEVKQSAYNFASYKPRTTQQVVKKLKSKLFDNHEIEVAISFLNKFNMLDDDNYCKKYIKDYLKKKPVGPKKLYFELLQKGIEKDTSQQAIQNQYPYSDIESIAIKAIEKKLKRTSKLTAENKKQKISAYLFQEGFDSSTIRKIINEYFE